MEIRVPAEMLAVIRDRIDQRRRTRFLPRFQREEVLHICGSLGYSCCITPAGEVYTVLDPTFQHLPGDHPPIIDRSRHGQLLVLIVGGKHHPELLTLLPARPAQAVDCTDCRDGWLHVTDKLRFICSSCGGLGWLGENDPNVPPPEMTDGILPVK